tara:strand:- start:3035 stop:4180 length:1146 start_codon:yes stop_codon:yes gene_type:complete
MKISKQELDQIIKEELDIAIEEGFLDSIKSMGSRAGSKVAGAFGADTASREMGARADALRDKNAAEKAKKRGKRDRRAADDRARKSGQTYPATELTALAATLRNVASKSGVPFPGGRGNMVKALEKVLRSGGFALDEAKGERVFIGQEGNIKISADTAPVFVKWLSQVKEKAPDVFASVASELANYRFDVPEELAAAAGEEEEDIDVDALAGSDEELAGSADAISAAAGGEDVDIQLDPEGGDTEIDLTDEPAAEAAVAQSFDDLEYADTAAAINLLRRVSGEAGSAILRIDDLETAKDLAIEKVEASKSPSAPKIRAALELTTKRLVDLLRSGLGKKGSSALAEWTNLELKAAEVLLESVTHVLSEAKETSRWKVISGIR